jgi:hypothetical protein
MLPDWNVAGVIPPIYPGVSGVDFRRSPYVISCLDFVERFNFSDDRREILSGFLRYRAALSSIGIVNGVQWVDGSFLEDIENLDGRAPRDVDVVTFFHIPGGMSQVQLVNANADLFDHDYVKRTFKVDSYYSPLGQTMSADDLAEVTYWYSMWSHRRDGVWKGFAQLALTDDTETQALDVLEPIEDEEEGNE